jgi:hypothetical protein
VYHKAKERRSQRIALLQSFSGLDYLLPKEKVRGCAIGLLDEREEAWDVSSGNIQYFRSENGIKSIRKIQFKEQT